MLACQLEICLVLFDHEKGMFLNQSQKKVTAEFSVGFG